MLNNVIYNYIKSLELPDLAVYDGVPAIFEQQAPEDTDPDWEGMQYGRVVYDLRMQDDPARKVSGFLRIMTAYIDAEELKLAEHLLQEAFDRTFFSSGLTIATTWQKTEPFVTSGKTDMDVFGNILYFDVDAFPVKKIYPAGSGTVTGGIYQRYIPGGVDDRAGRTGGDMETRSGNPGNGCLRFYGQLFCREFPIDLCLYLAHGCAPGTGDHSFF